jgi:hypothetical protein
LKLRAFAVMPFGVVDIELAGRSNPLKIDFDRVYRDLIVPALQKADCEPFRADSQISAGDIRTDMFFELVTADVVVADLSIPNPNVYYELGIRDGVCARGVLIIQGGLSASQPFDVAQDRCFKYDGMLFSLDHDAAEPPAEHSKEIAEAIDNLASVLSRALASDAQGTGSPLYAHLPGLIPVNWDGIEISRARYFGTLQQDWEERVRRAQEMDRPGHIITIAQDAPTRLHRTKILSEAARALIGLCQLAAAEEVLEEILQLTPDDINSQLYLGVVQAIRGDTERAERQMRYMLRQHEANPKAGAALGFVYRVLWYLQWKDDPNPRERAKQSSRLLLSSIRSFYNVQRLHPEEYLSGYNALLLMAVTAELFPGLELPPRLVDREELAVVVRYAANSARENAEETGDYDTQFWSAVALSGLEMLKDNKSGAIQGIVDACSVPSATLFFLQLLRERMDLLRRLNFKSDIVNAAIETVDAALHSKKQQQKWAKVVVFHGYPIDKPNLSVARFPVTAATAVGNRIDEALDAWKIGKGDLAICGGSTEGDVMFGEKCLAREAQVRLLILEPTPLQLAEVCSDPVSSEWATRSSSLVDHPATEVWYHRAELGDPVERAYAQGRHNRWILYTARMEAENASEETRLYGLILSDGSLKVTDPEDSSFFISEIRASNRYKGHVLTIDPCRLQG